MQEAGCHTVKWPPTCPRKPWPPQAAFHPLVHGDWPQEHGLIRVSSHRCTDRSSSELGDGGFPSPFTHHALSMTEGPRFVQKVLGY